MKKLFIISALPLLLFGFTYAGEVIIEVKAAYFNPSEQAFKDIYGGGRMFGGEVSVGIFEGFSLWLGGSYLTRDGVLTFTQEETKLEIMPLGGGIKYFFPMLKIAHLYAGVGVNYYAYKEENPIGNVIKGGIGYLGKIGILIKVFKGLMLDAFVNYSYCKMMPADYEINIGGIEAGVGLGFRF